MARHLHEDGQLNSSVGLWNSMDLKLYIVKVDSKALALRKQNNNKEKQKHKQFLYIYSSLAVCKTRSEELARE